MMPLLLAYRMQEYLGIKPSEPLPPCMSLAWHPVTSQLAIASSHSHVHVCNAGAAASRKQKQDAADLQSELLLWHQIQQQVQAATCLPWSSELRSTDMPTSCLAHKILPCPAYVASMVTVLQAWHGVSA